jgi:predicted kinase
MKFDETAGGQLTSGGFFAGYTPRRRILLTQKTQKSNAGPRLIIVCGLPGAGKTTHAKRLEETLGAVRFCPDEWMAALALDLYDEARRTQIEILQWKLSKDLLARGFTVIIEWGTWGRLERDVLRLGARALGAAVELHYLSAPIEVLFARIQRRGMEDPPLTRQDLQRCSAMFQAPTAAEGTLFEWYQMVGQGEAAEEG